MKVETCKKSFLFQPGTVWPKIPLLIQGFFLRQKTRRSLWQQDWERHFSNPGAVVLEGGDRFIFRGFTGHKNRFQVIAGKLEDEMIPQLGLEKTEDVIHDIDMVLWFIKKHLNWLKFYD